MSYRIVFHSARAPVCHRSRLGNSTRNGNGMLHVPEHGNIIATIAKHHDLIKRNL